MPITCFAGRLPNLAVMSRPSSERPSIFPSQAITTATARRKSLSIHQSHPMQLVISQAVESGPTISRLPFQTSSVVISVSSVVSQSAALYSSAWVRNGNRFRLRLRFWVRNGNRFRNGNFHPTCWRRRTFLGLFRIGQWYKRKCCYKRFWVKLRNHQQHHTQSGPFHQKASPQGQADAQAQAQAQANTKTKGCFSS